MWSSAFLAARPWEQQCSEAARCYLDWALRRCLHAMPTGQPAVVGAIAGVELGPDGLAHFQRALDELRLDMERSRSSHREERRGHKGKKDSST